jgi:hypothetical protein
MDNISDFKSYYINQPAPRESSTLVSVDNRIYLYGGMG